MSPPDALPPLPTELPDGRAPLFVITGFLGSGKTTLLRRMLQDPGLTDTAVLINEIGEIGIDNLLVKEVRDELIVLTSGCICCQVLRDLATSIKDLFGRREAGEIPRFSRLVVETTGLADPAPIVQTLLHDPALEIMVHLDSVITTVDAVLGEGQLDEQEEAVRQAALADRIVLTKTDIAEAATTERLRLRLAELNAAPILQAVHGDIPPHRLLGAGLVEVSRRPEALASWVGRPAHADGHTSDVRTLALRFARPIEVPAFGRWATVTANREGRWLLRMKGILDFAGKQRPQVFQAVQHILFPRVELPAWPSSERGSRLVIITRGLPEKRLVEIRESLERAVGQTAT